MGCVKSSTNSPLPPSRKGMTPLHIVALMGSTKNLREVLKSNPDMNAQDEMGRTALWFAVEDRSLDRIKILSNAGATCDSADNYGLTPLCLAAVLNFYDGMRALIASKPNLDVRNKKGMTVLHIAALLGHLKIVNLLLASGARFDIVDLDGRTFMYYLISFVFVRSFPSEDVPLLEKILDRTREIQIIDHKMGATAAHYIGTVHDEHVDIAVIKLVISKQHDINIENHFGKTPLNLLLQKCFHMSANLCIELIQFMVQKGAYVTKEDCKIILRNVALRDTLFMDADLCARIIMHNFNHKSIPEFYSLLHPTTKISSMEVMRMTLLPQVLRVIRNDIQCEIARKGYCDVSSLVTTSLSKRCIDVYVSYHLKEMLAQNECTCLKEENSSIHINGE